MESPRDEFFPDFTTRPDILFNPPVHTAILNSNHEPKYRWSNIIELFYKYKPKEVSYSKNRKGLTPLFASIGEKRSSTGNMFNSFFLEAGFSVFEIISRYTNVNNVVEVKGEGSLNPCEYAIKLFLEKEKKVELKVRKMGMSLSHGCFSKLLNCYLIVGFHYLVKLEYH